MVFRSVSVRAHWAAYVSVMALAVGAFVAGWSARQERMWRGMQVTAHEAAREVGLSTRSARDSIYMLQGVANGLFQQTSIELSDAHRAALAERLDIPGSIVLLPGAQAAHHTARSNMQNFSDSPAFSMVGKKPMPRSEQGREIEIALALGPALIRAKMTQSAAAAVYYLSGSGFHLIFPSVADELQLFTAETLRQAPYLSGLVERNPSRTPVWSAAYDDPKGKGLISTLGIPIDDAQGNYRGIAAMDFQLDSLSQYVRRPGLGIATAFILDGNDRVIAHPTMVGGASDHAPTLAEVAERAGASSDWGPLRTAPANNRQVLARDTALVYDIESSTWRYVIVVDRAKLRWTALYSMEIETVGLGGLLLLLAYAEKRRRDAVVSLRRKAAEEVLQAAPAPIAVMRQGDLSIAVANAALLRLFAVPGARDTAQAEASAHEQLPELIRTLTEQTLSDVDALNDAPLQRADGSSFWVLVRCVPVVHEEQPAWLCSLTDVTALKRARDQLETLATTDPLTGALNRRAVGERGHSEIRRSRRNTTSVSALLLDIDHFKCVNDTHGHPAGDLVLQAVAAACQAGLRQVDIFGRWGGEEFIVLLPETDLLGAVSVAERMRQAVEALSLVVDGDEPVRPTVSVGVAVCQVDDESLEPLLGRCDAALYQAKHSGRNRVCIGSAPGATLKLARSDKPADTSAEPLHPLTMGM